MKTRALSLTCSGLVFLLAGCGQPPTPNAEPTTAEKAELAVKNAVAVATAKTKEIAREVRELAAEKIVEWHLRPSSNARAAWFGPKPTPPSPNPVR